MEEIFSYDEFGIEEDLRSLTNQPFGYTGYKYDDISELNFAEARYYGQLHGRFTGIDNIKVYMTYLDSLNPYVYVYNKPKDHVDENGNIAVSATAITTLKFDIVGATKQSINDISTNYKEHNFDISEWEWSPLRHYMGSAVSGGIAFPLSFTKPVLAAGVGKFIETWIKENSFDAAIEKGFKALVTAGMLKGEKVILKETKDIVGEVVGIESDILGKVKLESLPYGWGDKIGTVIEELNENTDMVKKVAKDGFSSDIAIENIAIYKLSTSIKSDIKKAPRKYVEDKLGYKRVQDTFCPA